MYEGLLRTYVPPERIERSFTFGTCDNTGLEGWLPDWERAPAASGPGRVVVHDVLDHLLPGATLEAEFVAFGVITWGRLQGGWYDSIQTWRGPVNDIASSLVGELERNGAYIPYGETRTLCSLRQPPRMPWIYELEPLLEEIKEQIHRLLRDGDYTALAARNEAARATNFVRLGAHLAQRTYRGTPHDFTDMFVRMTEAVDAVKHPTEGDTLTFVVNPQDMSYELLLTYAEDEAEPEENFA